MSVVAIVQSNYIPWKGYFDLIAAVDEFVLLDDVQYTRRDWRNRNSIKTPDGLRWLTVPVATKGQYSAAIRDIRIDGTDWIGKHLRALEINYAAAPHADAVLDWLAPILRAGDGHLSTLNRALIERICGELAIPTRITSSADFQLVDGPTERLLAICQQAGARRYISGPAARGYLDESRFAEADIAVEWFRYDGYPEYPQLWGGFAHAVTIVDLLMNCGPDARAYMKCGRA
jgi:hypothetical protein